MTLEMTGAKIPFSETLRGRPRNIPFVFHLLRRHTSHYLLELKWSVRGDEGDVCTTLNRRVSEQRECLKTQRKPWRSRLIGYRLRLKFTCEGPANVSREAWRFPDRCRVPVIKYLSSEILARCEVPL